MRSAYKVFKGAQGQTEVLARANDFVAKIGRENLITINTLIDPSEVAVSGIRSRMSFGAYPEELLVVVWYWDAEASAPEASS